MSTLGAVAHRPAKMSSVDAGPGLGSTPAISNRASWHRRLTAAPTAVAVFISIGMGVLVLSSTFQQPKSLWLPPVLFH